MEEKRTSPVEKLLDDKNFDNITLYNEDDKAFEFEQIAIIPMDKKLYAILKPVAKLEGLSEDEAVAFEVDENLNTITVVLDDNVIDKLFAKYEKMIEDEDKKDKKDKK